MSPGSPLLALRQQLMRLRGERLKTVSIKVKMALIIKAWNKAQAGKVVYRINWPAREMEAFPDFSGFEPKRFKARAATQTL